MELWIRSQNKGALIKVEMLGNTDGTIKSYKGINQTELGTYKSSERALEILDEIQKVVGWIQKDMKYTTIGDINHLIGCYDNYVYEMPQE